MLLATLKSIWVEVGIVILMIICSLYVGYQLGLSKSGGDTQSEIVLRGPEEEQNKVVDQIAELNNPVLINNLAPQSTEDELKFESNELEIVFGSVNGTKYYNYGCKSGDRIKSENKIFFENAAEALLAGYEPSVNCDF